VANSGGVAVVAAEPAGVEVPIVWRGRRARAVVPALLAERDLAFDEATVVRTVRARAELEHAAEELPDDVAALARLLLRAEGVASSFIEGVTAPVVDIVLAESLDGEEHTPASWVAANLAAVSDAIDAAHDAPLTVDTLCRWHRTLMAGSPTPDRFVGVLRDEQGWIGGTSPLDAHLVTPPPDHVPALMGDLLRYVARDDIEPVAQAAIAHAQFEIIHPFADGNGRIGRVLVASILVRRLSLLTAPPVSARLAADVGGYTSGLTLFRMGDHRSWVRWFADAVSGAGRAQRDLVEQVARLGALWERRLDDAGVRRDATARRVLGLLPSHLVMTASTVAQRLDVPRKTALAALVSLADAGVLVEHGDLRRVGAGRPSRLFVSAELLGLAGASPLRR
jgi:Fic family protein